MSVSIARAKNADAKRASQASRASSPWLNLAEAAAYEKRGKRWLRQQVKDKKCRAAIIGGRSECMFLREWLDDHLQSLATPVLLTVRRRA